MWAAATEGGYRQDKNFTSSGALGHVLQSYRAEGRTSGLPLCCATRSETSAQGEPSTVQQQHSGKGAVCAHRF